MPCMVYKTCIASHTYSSDSLFWLVSLQYMCECFESMPVLMASQKCYQECYITVVIVRSTIGVISANLFQGNLQLHLVVLVCCSSHTLLVNHVIMTVIIRSSLTAIQQYPSRVTCEFVLGRFCFMQGANAVYLEVFVLCYHNKLKLLVVSVQYTQSERQKTCGKAAQGSQTTYCNNLLRHELVRLCNVIISSSSHPCNC